MSGFLGVFLAAAAVAAPDGLMSRYADRLPAGRSVRFCATADVSPERYAVADGMNGEIVVSGATRRACVYGLGRLLREPDFRSASEPGMPLRGIYFATHFGNWYDRATDREIAEYVEDLALWGCNQVRVWFDMHDFKGADDPRAVAQAAKLKRILLAAERCGLETSLVALANEGFADSPQALRADWRAGRNGYRHELVGHYHVEICPSKPGGLERILADRASVLDLFAGVKLSNVSFFPYDQGGCTCAGCAPWGVNGMFKILPGFSRLVKERFPGCRIDFGTWRFDAFGDLGEWKGLFARGEELRRFADEISVERVDEIVGGAPGGLPASAMSEISMDGMLPWGGYGANPRPRRYERQVRGGQRRLAGFRPYSEGIYEDLNKVIFLALGWDSSRSADEAVKDYARLYFGSGAEEVAEAVVLLEENLGHSSSFVQDGKSYGVYDAVKIDRSRPFVRRLSDRRPDLAKARRACDLLEGVDRILPSDRRTSWRWRILLLRARIDVRLAEGAEADDPQLVSAFEELARIYKSDARTEPCLAPVLANAADAVPDNAFGFRRPDPEGIEVIVNSKAELGPIKPVHGVNNGPMKARADQCCGNFEAYRDARIPSARTHDAVFSQAYGGAHTIDISAVFPDFDADVDDPKSYDFHYTDFTLDNIQAAGTEVYYRLGQSIEHGGKKYHVGPPKDAFKWAKACEHLIRHCNEGWADGKRRGIRHWEIWNEADNNSPDNPTCWGGTDEEFFAFYETVAKHLKGCFPNLAIGGPAVGWNEDWARRFIEYAHAHEVPLDFFSWHGYDTEPRQVAARAARMRKLLDANGYTATESHMTEWNYVRGWSSEWVYSMRAESGDRQEKGAAYVAAVLTELQGSSVALAHYYDARPGTSMNGLFHPVTARTMRGYYPFYAWSNLRDLGTQVSATAESPDKDVYVTAARGADGRLGILVARFSNDNNVIVPRRMRIRVNGASPAGARAYMTDYASLYTEFRPSVDADGTVSFAQEPDSFVYVEVGDGLRSPENL